MPHLNGLKERAAREVERLEEPLWALSQKIHANPELNFKEVKAAAWIAEELERLGFQVERGAGGVPTAFKAVYDSRRPGPTVAVQAEYDALPEIGHACGHNLIATAAVGGGAAVKAVIEEVGGRIVVMGTPAEEGGGGKIIMLEKGAFDDVDASLYIHPQAKNSVSGSNMAHGSVTVKLRGVPASPSGGKAPEGQEHLGASALAALTATFHLVDAIRQHIERDVIVRGRIVAAGAPAETVPLYAEAKFSVRGPNHILLKEVLGRIENCARGAALAVGTDVECQRGPLYAERVPLPSLMEAIRDNMGALGVTDVEEDRASSSTDSGNVSQLIPLGAARVKISDKGVTPHSRAFAEAAISDRGRIGMVLGAKILAWTALDLLGRPDLLELVRKQFRASTGREPGVRK